MQSLLDLSWISVGSLMDYYSMHVRSLMDLLGLDLDVEHLLRARKALRKCQEAARRLTSGPRRLLGCTGGSQVVQGGRGGHGCQGWKLTQEASDSLRKIDMHGICPHAAQTNRATVTYVLIFTRRTPRRGGRG